MDNHPQSENTEKKLKPARKQVKPGEVSHNETPQTGKEYNIWYNKWAGGEREDNYSNKVKSQTRCNIRKDSGYTRADQTGFKYTCLFFARGCCPYGYECNFLHKLPDPTVVLPDASKDCFARDKFSDYRDDMGGVGSFNRQNRTLYVGRIKETGNANETEEVVRRHFRMFGEIEKIRILQYRSVAFVTYVHETHGQFAKEAMACQSLDNDEILNVRWATEDPNPTAKVAEKRRLEEQGAQAIANKLDPRMVDAMRAIRALEDEEEVPQLAPPSPKRRRIEDGEGEVEELEEQEEEPPLPEEEPVPQAGGILSADTLQGLKYFAEIRQRQAVNAPNSVSAGNAPTATVGLSSLGDYGSDDED